MLTAPPDRRSVTIPPTASTGISNTEILRAAPPPHISYTPKKQAKAPVGLIVGVGVAVIAALFGLFFVRWMFVRKKRRREAFAGPGRTLGGKDKDAVELASYPPPALPAPSSAPPSLPPTHAQSRSTPFSGTAPSSTPLPGGAGVGAEPGPQSTPAARQAYLAAELRAAQSLLERAAPGRNNLGDKTIDVKATKARIRELEQRQGSAWALGLE
ncbi:hypothetical protein MSAN_01583300 [Mycena sanguinolenta]|uniref:Uncharacterized protein n=1 Tax=Mycena sanguinolenta TaxID=230812 RepID=A0A8H6Y021_9AGAR|nr:hypothetical protein MSAN_01583300 [Mycena sanguinolenta]